MSFQFSRIKITCDPFPVSYLPLSACTDWETSHWLASAAATGWHGTSAQTCPRHHPHMSMFSFYDAADEHQRTRPAVNPSQRDMARRQDSVLGRISDLWRPPSGIPLPVTCPQYITHTCHFAGVNWRAHCECQHNSSRETGEWQPGLPINAKCWQTTCLSDSWDLTQLYTETRLSAHGLERSEPYLI